MITAEVHTFVTSEEDRSILKHIGYMAYGARNLDFLVLVIEKEVFNLNKGPKRKPRY